MKRGDIYYIESNHQETGSEQRAGRPAVIVSNDQANQYSNVIEVVYLTTQPKDDLPTHFDTRSSSKPSTVLCEQISSVYIDRVGNYIGHLSDREMQQLDISLSISIGIDWMLDSQKPTEGGYQEEELAKLREAIQNMPATIMPVPQEDGELIQNLRNENIRLQAQLDLMKEMYGDAIQR